MSTEFSVARPAAFSADWSAKAESPLRAVVIGGSGQIGGWLLRSLDARGHHAVGTYSSQPFSNLIALDASDRDGVSALLRAERPDVVFYPAGFTWVDGCERDTARAYAANLEQPLHVARTAADLGARFVYFSTDYVFDGVEGRYSEDSPVHPLSVYGKAKYDAEVALAEALGDRVLTARTCWVYGPERQGKNFSYQLIGALRQGKPMICPSDQVSSPSYGPDVARAVLMLVEAGASGLIHVVGPEIMDRVKFARAIARAFHLDESLITPKTTAELGQGAPRPLNAGLLIDRLDSCKAGLMRPLGACLEDYRGKLDSPELRSWLAPVVPGQTSS